MIEVIMQLGIPWYYLLPAGLITYFCIDPDLESVITLKCKWREVNRW